MNMTESAPPRARVVHAAGPGALRCSFGAAGPGRGPTRAGAHECDTLERSIRQLGSGEAFARERPVNRRRMARLAGSCERPAEAMAQPVSCPSARCRVGARVRFGEEEKARAFGLRRLL